MIDYGWAPAMIIVGLLGFICIGIGLYRIHANNKRFANALNKRAKLYVVKHVTEKQ